MLLQKESFLNLQRSKKVTRTPTLYLGNDKKATAFYLSCICGSASKKETKEAQNISSKSRAEMIGCVRR
jgi:hypothetical protein